MEETTQSPKLEEAAEPTAEPRRARGFVRSWLRRLLIGFLVLGALLVPLVAYEARTSRLQARFFSDLAGEIGHTVEPGPSPAIRFPAGGPHDTRLGYDRIPDLVASAVPNGFEIVAQARGSERYLELVDRGVFPIFVEKPQGGLVLEDRRGDVFHATRHPARIYPTFEDIPEPILASLLFIESRDLLDPRYPKRNPAVEWDRLAVGVFGLLMQRLGSERNVPGGSTLATQLEKFRHAPDGRTATPKDKVVQMVSASLRAYQDGPETLAAQRRVVLDYLNSVPLAAQRSHGEVTGTSDGLWAWYGTDFDEANHALRTTPQDPEEAAERGRIYRQALSLLIAHRRPSYYLVQADGRRELDALVERHLRLLGSEGVVDPELTAAALDAEVVVLDQAPERPRPSFVRRKAIDQTRTRLLTVLRVPSLYDLDRFDLHARASLDLAWHDGVSDVLASLSDRAFLQAGGFVAPRLLARGDPEAVVYSFTLLERTPLGNVVRVQTDNLDAPLNLSEGARLELGSTAKLRTLVTYVEVVEELYERLHREPAAEREAPAASDRLTRWAVEYLARNPDATLERMLQAALERTYSANPSERFATGGGVQTFSNFDATFDVQVLTVREAFVQSVNLPSIRTMRDIVQYEIQRDPDARRLLTAEGDDPARIAMLERFADREGTRFLRRFHRRYDGLSPVEMLDVLFAERRLSPERIAWALRTVAPDAPREWFAERFAAVSTEAYPAETVERLYERSDPTPYDLQDLGYLARVHPLELWVVRHLIENPDLPFSDLVDDGAEARQEVYRWLFRTSRRRAQDTRIATMLELEAFERILDRWQRLGYPFRNLVPSLGTAIGSSGDRPIALAELMGIIQNGGVRYPIVRIEAMTFAEGTPFETRLAATPAGGVRVLSPAVADALRAVLVEVVERGTARRARSALRDPEGEPLRLGGKTGTGDNRLQLFDRRGVNIGSRVVNRTATLAFLAGDRYFGVVTAFVPGEQAGAYDFTSALASQVLQAVGPRLQGIGAPVVAGEPDPVSGGADTPATPVGGG